MLPENYISDLGVWREGRSSGDDAPSRLRMTGDWFLMSVLAWRPKYARNHLSFPQRDRSIKVGWPTVKVLYISVGVQVASILSLGKRGGLKTG